MTKHIIYLFLLALILNSCSNTKYLAPGQKLYTGGKVKIDSKDIKKSDASALTSDLQSLLRPIPNGSILGLRVKLWVYNKTKARNNFIKRFLFKFGEPPVLVSSVDLENNAKILQNRLQNLSYFQAQVVGDTIGKAKTASALYTAQPGPAYKFKSITYPAGKDDLDTAIAGTQKGSLLKLGDNYNLDTWKNERLRIDARLKEEGFYYFSDDDIKLRMDSSAADHHIDAKVVIKDIPDRATWIWTIGNIYIYPNYTLKDTSMMLDKAVRYNNYNVVQKKENIHPYVFKNVVQFQPNSVYNRTDHNKALNRFVELGPYKFVKNRFDDYSPDSPKLNIYYFLTPYPKKSLRFELLGRTTSANYNGTQATISWRNRNTFKGAELLTVSLFGSSDVQVSGQNSGYNVYQAGIQTSLSWPRFFSPFDLKSSSAFVPHTNLTLQYELTNRTKLYTLNSFSASFGYQWKENVHRSHELTLFGFTYVNAASISQQYLDSIKHTSNPSLKHVIDNQLTFGPSYSYTVTNTTEDYRTNTYYYNAKVGLSANILGLVTGADTLAGKVKSIFHTPYDQYVKLEQEYRFYHKTGPNSLIAARAIVGVGLTYGNSTIMPYSQQFFIGGSNSLRGFRARSIGPGSYQPEQNNGSGFLPDESGDIKIEANVEYRPKLFSIVRGAVFVDAGNIWDLRSHNGLEGGTFGKNFLTQIAADAGVGLRFDLTVLVLRTDLGFPLLKPWDAANRFNLDTKNGVFNIAIGYPF